MGLLSWTAGLPLTPVRGLIAIGRVMQRQVDAELHDPAAVRRRLEALDEAQRQGRISPDEAQRRQEAIVREMAQPYAAGRQESRREVTDDG